MITISLEDKKLRRWLEGKLPQAIARARQEALKAGVRAVRSQTSQLIRKDLNNALKASEIKSALYQTPPKISRSVDRVVIRASERGMPLVRFAPRTKQVRTRRGKRRAVTVRTRSGRQVVRGAFWAKMPTFQTQGIWWRNKRGAKPLVRQLYSTSVADGFMNVKDQIARHTAQVMRRQFIGKLRHFDQMMR